MDATSTASCVSPAHTATAENGFVLIAVLWMLAILAVLVLALSNTVRLDVQSKANLTRQAQAEALADGMTLSIAARIVEQLAGQPALATNGTILRCSIDGAQVAVSITDVAGLIDLNAAPVELLARVIAGIGVPAGPAAKLAAAIGDFRDIDDEPLAGGAEAKDYRTGGMPFGPKNAPLETVEELDQVLGMTPTILNRLRELVTVHARSPAIDLQHAPPALVAALAAGTPATAGIATDNARAQLAAQFPSLGGGLSRTQEVTVGVTTPMAGHFRRHAVIDVSNAAPLGFAIREWSAWADTGDPEPPHALTRACTEFGF
jgi:general secretion pathway protein K